MKRVDGDNIDKVSVAERACGSVPMTPCNFSLNNVGSPLGGDKVEVLLLVEG